MRHDEDAGGIGEGQQHAGDDAGHEQAADRLLAEHAVEDEQQARRDQHAEHRRAGDDADRERRAVAVAQHLGHRDFGEDCGRGDADAGDGGEDRVGRDRGDAKPARDASEQLVGDVERVLADVGDADQQAHQHEQRHDAEDIVRDGVVGGERHHVAGDRRDCRA